MKKVTITEFRKRASELLCGVEKGETFAILRHGKPIAEVRPVARPEHSAPCWRRPGLRLALKGVSLSTAIIEERGRG